MKVKFYNLACMHAIAFFSDISCLEDFNHPMRLCTRTQHTVTNSHTRIHTHEDRLTCTLSHTYSHTNKNTSPFTHTHLR